MREKLIGKQQEREKVDGWLYFDNKKGWSWCQRVQFDNKRSIEVFLSLHLAIKKFIKVKKESPPFDFIF